MAKVVKKVYGDALFSLAVEQDQLDFIWDEVISLMQVLTESEDLQMVMSHPSMTGDEKMKLVQRVFGEKLSDTMMGFLTVLVKKGRFTELLPILSYFDAKAKEYRHIGVVYVTSAISLSEEQKKKVEERLLKVSEYESFEMHYIVDTKLIGGMIVRIGDRVFDNSIAMKLDQMSKSLKKLRLNAK